METEGLGEMFSGLSVDERTELLGRMVKDEMALMDEEHRRKFWLDLSGQAARDKISSMVHLWLAECLGEGVDPTKMCQSLVSKVDRSEQLKAVAEPEVLALFEDWMDELEEEVLAIVKGPDSSKGQDNPDHDQVARRLGLSRAGAVFLLTKLANEGRT